MDGIRGFTSGCGHPSHEENETIFFVSAPVRPLTPALFSDRKPTSSTTADTAPPPPQNYGAVPPMRDLKTLSPSYRF
eukprot:scaffold244_cov172-Amphora_coffeaeformis.AAC.56